MTEETGGGPQIAQKKWWVNSHEQTPKACSEAQERKSKSGEQ